MISCRRRFPADLGQLRLIRDFVQGTAEAWQAEREAILDIVQAVDEAVTNIILHGYQGRPGSIELEVRREGDALVVSLRDRAWPFDPTPLPPPDLTLPLEQRPGGGLGVHLIKAFTDEVRHRTLPQGGNELTLMKRTHFAKLREEGPNGDHC